MKQTFEQVVERIMDGGLFLEEAVELLERTLITMAMERTAGNRSAASKLLGIHRNTLQRKLLEYKLERKPPQKTKHRPNRAATGS
jgi:DNA-binding NtrC family response regulator